MDNKDTVLREFQEVLDRHGHGFQHAVINAINDLRSKERTDWSFVATEFPVSLGRGSRIDFLLEHFGSWNANPKLILAECKRVNPALANWCFLRAPYVRSNQRNYGYIYESIVNSHEQDGPPVQTTTRHYVDTRIEPYHIALEVKSEQAGTKSGGKPEAIEDAATQICVGLGGMIQTLSTEPHLFSKHGVFHLLPTIFTTAKLWASESNLKDSDLSTGNIDLSKSDFLEKDWLILNYVISPGIKHNVYHSEATRSFGEFMESEYVRSIAVVSTSGIQSYLRWAEVADLDFR